MAVKCPNKNCQNENQNASRSNCSRWEKFSIALLFCVFNDKFCVEKKKTNETDFVCFEMRITQTHEILLITSSLPVSVTTSSVNSYFTLKIYQTPFSQFDFSLVRFFVCPCVCVYDGSIFILLSCFISLSATAWFRFYVRLFKYWYIAQFVPSWTPFDFRP